MHFGCKKRIFSLKTYFSQHKWATTNRSWEWNDLTNVTQFIKKIWCFGPWILYLKDSDFFRKKKFMRNNLSWITVIFWLQSIWNSFANKFKKSWLGDREICCLQILLCKQPLLKLPFDVWLMFPCKWYVKILFVGLMRLM